MTLPDDPHHNVAGKTEVRELGLRAWIARAGAVLCAAVAAITLTLIPHKVEAERAQHLPVCDTGQHLDCLTPVEGSITQSRRSGKYGGQRHLFVPRGPASRDTPQEWVHLFGDSKGFTDRAPEINELLSGREVRALYWDQEILRFETPSGTVVPIGQQPGSWLDYLAGALIAAGLAICAWNYPINKPRRGSPSVAARGVRLWFNIGAALAVTAPIPVFFVTGFKDSLIAFGCTLLVMVLLVAWGRRWSRRNGYA